MTTASCPALPRNPPRNPPFKNRHYSIMTQCNDINFVVKSEACQVCNKIHQEEQKIYMYVVFCSLQQDPTSFNIC